MKWMPYPFERIFLCPAVFSRISLRLLHFFDFDTHLSSARGRSAQTWYRTITFLPTCLTFQSRRYLTQNHVQPDHFAISNRSSGPDSLLSALLSKRDILYSFVAYPFPWEKNWYNLREKINKKANYNHFLYYLQGFSAPGFLTVCATHRKTHCCLAASWNFLGALGSNNWAVPTYKAVAERPKAICPVSRSEAEPCKENFIRGVEWSFLVCIYQHSIPCSRS